MKKNFFILLIAFISYAASAEVNCWIKRGEEVIDVKVIDSFAGLVAMISRTHPLVEYPAREVYVSGKETSKSYIFSNSEDKFSLKLIKESRLSSDALPYFQGDLKFEDISTKINCLLF